LVGDKRPELPGVVVISRQGAAFGRAVAIAGGENSAIVPAGDGYRF